MKSQLHLLFGLLAACHVPAAVRLPSILSDHAVLTRTERVPIWGWADPNEEVGVTFGDRSAKTKADTAGKWQVDLNLVKSPDGPFELTVTGSNTLVVKDVIVGEVWVASGQSNMDWRVGQWRHCVGPFPGGRGSRGHSIRLGGQPNLQSL